MIPPPPPLSPEEFARRFDAGARTMEELEPEHAAWLRASRRHRAFLRWATFVMPFFVVIGSALATGFLIAALR